MGYAELRCHTAFSFGDGACTPEALVERAAAMGYTALGLTDTADLGGAIRFALACERHGVRPVVGAELIVDGHPAAFLATSETGFRNLAGLVTRARVGALESFDFTAEAQRRGEKLAGGSDPGHPPSLRSLKQPEQEKEIGFRSVQPPQTSSEDALGRTGDSLRLCASAVKNSVEEIARGRPRLTWRDIVERSDGLIALTGPASGEVASHLRAGRRSEAALALSRWKSLFGERLAVEVQLHHVSGAESALAGGLIELARAAGVPWAATNDPRYLDTGGRLVHDVLTALRFDADVDTAASLGFLLPNGEWRLKSPDEMARLWRGREEGLEATKRIALACDFDLRWLRPPLPRFPVPHGDDDSFLRELAFAGARRRWGELDARREAQLEHELGVIARLGFAGFFLVMWDAVRFARERGILCQGRGSAANSAVAYCLEITAVDPVREGLLFERFLSEHRTDGRTEAPDIDVDFEMHRREEVLDYMYRTYGRSHAAIAAVTQVYGAPTAVQDLMRGLGYPAEQAFRLSKRVHRYEPAEAADAVEAGLGEACGLDVATPRARALLAGLRATDGLPRLRSTHPGGFVLSRDPLGDFMPIERTTMGRTILQFDKDDLDAAGVPKFDFLGLGGLSAVHIAFEAVEKRTGRKLELYSLPTDDPRTFEMIAAGDTVGTFQIESRAQIQSILQTRPERLYDLVVQVALIRPGPIQAKFVRPYTRRRRGLEPVEYADPRLEPILRRTQGIPIFQEQAMAIAMALGGYSAGDADQLRRSMGHQRKAARLHAELERLRDAMVRRGVAPDVAEAVADDLRVFANYGFPESHAWSFALIAYATAYLKAHYPAEFFLGMLNAWPMGFYPPSTLVHTARRDGVTVLPPCLKDGAWECMLVTDSFFTAEAQRRGEVRGVGSGTGVPATAPGGAECFGSVSTRDPKQPGGIHLHEIGSTRTQLKVESGAFRPCERRSPPHAAPPEPSAPLRLCGENEAPALRIGWRFVRGLGDRTRQALQAARAESPFTGVEDVVRRAKLSRAEALHLARAGAFEAFEPGRRRAAWEALRAAGDVLPLAPARRLPFRPRELEGEELVFLDYLATGICTHGHPVEHLRERLRAAGVVGADALERQEDGARVVVAGLVVVRQHPQTARGTVFVLLEDEFGFINVIVPARTYERNRETVKFSPFLVVEGTFERDGRVLNVIGRRFRRLEAGGLSFRSRDFR